jgi:hypothetical protein
MRIAKNNRLHAIWLKLSKMPRFMFPPWFSFSRGHLNGAVRKTLRSVKICKFATLRIFTRYTVTERWKQRQRYHEERAVSLADRATNGDRPCTTQRA